MANSQEDYRSQHPDLLAALVLHVLVSEGREGMDLATMTRACARNPRNKADRNETEVAAKILIADGLAQLEGELYRPTHAAVRAGELSF